MTVQDLTRRRFAGLVSLTLSTLFTRRTLAQEPPGDRGIGGTGYAPPVDRDDKGIGGTGVVGTIHRFGSIVVNDLRIGFDPDVAVTVDGQAAAARDLRIGHVVRALARSDEDGLFTRSIAVLNEVIGPVERQRGNRLTVLGQTVFTDSLPHPRRWARGTRVAVSGLRRPDGVIVASLVEPTRDRFDRVAGPLRREGDHVLRIGRLALRNIDPALIDQRVTVRGRWRRGALHAVHVESEASALASLGSDRLSLEVFLERHGATLNLGSGLAVESALAMATLPDRDVVRAVLSGSVKPGGHVVVDHISVVDRQGRSTSGPGGGSGPFGQGAPQGASRGGERGGASFGGRGQESMHGPGGAGPGGPGGAGGAPR